MQKRIGRLFPIAIIVITALLVFRQFIFSGLYPFPGDFMLAWYEPWKSENSHNGAITLPHKPIADDIFRQMYPMKVLGMEMIKQGQWPLWNPYNGAGQPLLATMHNGLLNPLNILFFLFDDITAWSLQVFLSVVFVGCTTYLYTRKIGMTSSAGVFSALTFMLSGFIVSRSIYNDYNFAVMCLPLLLYLFEDYIQQKKSKKILLFPLVIFYLFTVVQPQIILFILTFVICYIFFRLHTYYTTSKTTTARRFRNIALLLVTGFGLASVQLFPTFELYKLANVTTDSSKEIIDRFLLPASHMLSLVIPNYFGNQATYNYWGAGDYVESITSLGLLPVFFAWIAYFSTKQKAKSLTTFFISAAALSIILTINHIGTRFIYSLPIPIFSTGVPSRILFITSFSLAISAGFGFDYWRKVVSVNKSIVLHAGGFFILLAAIILYTLIGYYASFDCGNPTISSCRLIALRNTLLESVLFTAGIIICMTHIYMKKPVVKKTLQFALLVLIIVQGVYNAGKFLPFSKKEYILPKHTLIENVKENGKLNRIFGLGNANIKTNFATQYRFFDPNYYDPLYIKRYGELIAFANSNETSNTTRSDVEITNDVKLEKEKELRRERIFSLLSITNRLYPIRASESASMNGAQQTPFTSKNTPALPRAYVVTQLKSIPQIASQLKMLFSENFNPATTAIVEKDLSLEKEAGPIKSDITISEYSPNEIRLNTKTSTQSILILNDNYYPGWKAYIDGQEEKIVRANYTFRGVVLPAGTHEVLFSFKPFSLRYGLYSSGMFLIFYGLLYRFWPKISGDKKH